jgi:hypothetical protein
MKVYFNAFWGGFFEKTNAVHVDFFLDLCSKIWKTDCSIGGLDDSDILLETIFGDSVLTAKPWKYTILFSGESRIHSNTDEYTIVLYGQRNHKNIVNCPLFVTYLYCNGYTDKLINPPTIPLSTRKNEVLAIISNPNGAVRNKFLEMIEAHGIPVTYAGHYKNNIGGNLQHEYKTKEFLDYVSQFKFIVSMENSQEDTYITEKICHGFLANTVPVYWGSPRVFDYFNTKRFLHLESGSAENMLYVLSKMVQCFSNEDQYNDILSNSIYTKNEYWRTIDAIARDCRALLEKQNPFSKVQQIQFICNPEFEPERYNFLMNIIQTTGMNQDKVKFICPTYKHTITDEQYCKHVRTPLKHAFRGYINRNLRKSELSLTLNFLANLQEIDKNYMDGMFCIFESDIDILPNIKKVNELFDSLDKTQSFWDLVHIGSTGEHVTMSWNPGYIEDITCPTDTIRLERRVDPRCTDSLAISIQGVQKLLDYFTAMNDYCLPMDYYFMNLFKMNPQFKFYWSDPAYFYQRSNKGLIKSEIQNDLA